MIERTCVHGLRGVGYFDDTSSRSITPRGTLSSALFFNHETALLYAFLLMNDHFEIAASLSMLHYQRLNDLKRFCPDMKPLEFEG
jgi:hypothetical protein